MCNMKLLVIDRSSSHQEMIDNDVGGFNDVNVSEIGQTLAQLGDNLNDEALRKSNYIHIAAIAGIVLTFATIITFNNIAQYVAVCLETLKFAGEVDMIVCLCRRDEELTDCKALRCHVHIFVNIQILLAVFAQHNIHMGYLIVRDIDFEYGIFYIMFYIVYLAERCRLYNIGRTFRTAVQHNASCTKI